jgi:hypothetical protein
MPIPAIAAALAPAIGTLIDRLIPDKHEAEKAKADLERSLVDAANQINLEQVKTNQIEAAHRSIWVAGWRPAIGWACSVGFAWAFVGQPVAVWISAVWVPDLSLPALDTAPLIEMTFAMLGLAGMRSWEKSKGLAK